MLLQPQSVSFLAGDPSPAQRVVLVRTPGLGACHVIAKPSFITARLESLSETCWTLVITTNGGGMRAPVDGAVVVRHQPETGGAVDASCEIEVLGDDYDLTDAPEMNQATRKAACESAESRQVECDTTGASVIAEVNQ